MMKLNGQQIIEIRDALLEAFPSRQELAMLVRIRFNENLESIVDGENLSQVVFNLIKWAESKDMVLELISKSQEHNPGNDLLRRLTNTYTKTDIETSYHSPINPQTRLITYDELLIISRRILEVTGKRRTAYPTDMNFQELFNEKIYIEPKFVSANRDSSLVSNISQLAKEIMSGRNFILTGEPGTGKSFFSYLIHQYLTSVVADTMICLPVDIRICMGIMSESNFEFHIANVLKVILHSFRIEFISSFNIDINQEKIVFIVDGMDELSGEIFSVVTLVQLLSELTRFGRLLVTCRSRDFEYVFAPYLLNQTIFDAIIVMKEWSVEDEFAEFIHKLLSANRLADSNLLSRVRDSDTLTSLVSRPLHARMLTFVGIPDIEDISDISKLYSSYLSRYSRVVDSSLLRGSCISTPKTHVIWRECVWYIFQKDLLVHDKIFERFLRDFVIEAHGFNIVCVNRLLNPLFNYVDEGYQTWLQFIHYSFYEYLVAEYIANSLIGCCLSNSFDVYDYLRKDLSSEIRHHLIRIINWNKPENFGSWISRAYMAVNESDMEIIPRHISNNLIVYILGRIPQGANEMADLLEIETDKFLLTSIYWSLCNSTSKIYADRYFQVLDRDHEMRQLNRGYHLYYYGDINRTALPPYLDIDVSRGWPNARLRMSLFMFDRNYRTRVLPSRRALDLYTFYDFCISRGETIDKKTAELFYRLIEEITVEIGADFIVVRLKEMHTSVYINVFP